MDNLLESPGGDLYEHADGSLVTDDDGAPCCCDPPPPPPGACCEHGCGPRLETQFVIELSNVSFRWRSLDQLQGNEFDITLTDPITIMLPPGSRGCDYSPGIAIPAPVIFAPQPITWSNSLVDVGFIILGFARFGGGGLGRGTCGATRPGWSPVCLGSSFAESPAIRIEIMPIATPRIPTGNRPRPVVNGAEFGASLESAERWAIINSQPFPPQPESLTSSAQLPEPTSTGAGGCKSRWSTQSASHYQGNSPTPGEAVEEDIEISFDFDISDSIAPCGGERAPRTLATPTGEVCIGCRAPVVPGRSTCPTCGLCFGCGG